MISLVRAGLGSSHSLASETWTQILPGGFLPAWETLYWRREAICGHKVGWVLVPEVKVYEVRLPWGGPHPHQTP